MSDIGKRARGAVRSPRAGLGLCDVVESHGRYRGERIALIDDAGSITWAQLAGRIAAMANGLAERGIGRGDVVAVADGIGIDYVALYFATARLGAVLVPLNWRLNQASILSFIDRTTPKLVLAGARQLELVGGAAKHVIADTRDATWGEQLLSERTGMPASGAEFDDPHLIIFTSGTTGVPKAAVLSQRGTMVDSYAGALASGLRPDDRFFVYQAPYHGGTWALMRQYILVGASIVLTRSFEATRALEIIERHRCTSFFAVPLVLQGLVEAPNFEESDLSSLRNIVFASYDPNSVVRPVVEQIRRRGAAGLTIEHIYGQTENSSLITTARPEVCEQDIGSVGTPVPGVVVSIVDIDGRELPPGEVGEICVRSHSVMDGYLDNPEATAEAFRGGRLHTGDLGRLDERGMLHIVGRLKEMIRTGGVNVYPREIARKLGEHPAIRDCAVFGVPDPRYDERVVAAVVSSDPHLTPEEVIAWVRQRMAGYQTPRQVLILDELPKTAAGKTAMADLVHVATGRDEA
ncbi:class I adenylate-forming enzyme family protein [Amycolatopsis pithecellobii]|uniref:AMP-binding protein n=1 Tax=Amycolatopsis pithecellobii TaxID=664692 RepID=A0A6N7Z313_9PSEU|nr:AMP-binding protein [Amycolatopsis pithecellobii]MTD54324.1 AMP-binding protein [Amycolatopsis pithecellobii]